MPENAPDPKTARTKSSWAALPGVLTAAGGLIAAVATLLTALVGVGVIGPGKSSPAPSTSASPTLIATVASAAELLPSATQASSPTLAAPATPIPTLVAVTATVQPGGIIFEDDFSSQRNDWLAKVLPEDEKGYEAGEFRIAVFRPEWSSWTFPQPALVLSDFALEVDARRVSGPISNEYGVLVRHQAATDDFYLFEISSDGFFSVEKHVSGEWSDVVKWTESAAVLGGDEVNRLRVVCRGTEMHFFVNGEMVARVEDAVFSSGNIGLLASATDKGGVTVAFDNLRVRGLTEP